MIGDPRGPVQVVEAYGDGGFRISGTSHRGSVIVLIEACHAWPVSTLDEAQADHFAPLLAAADTVEILLLGCGPRIADVPAFLREACTGAGIVVEPMDTGAAARTYNLLASEGRQVAAALIAVE